MTESVYLGALVCSCFSYHALGEMTETRQSHLFHDIMLSNSLVFIGIKVYCSNLVFKLNVPPVVEGVY